MRSYFTQKFLKRTTWVAADAEALGRVGPAAVALAEAEGLQAHARSVAMRLGQSGPEGGSEGGPGGGSESGPGGGETSGRGRGPRSDRDAPAETGVRT